MRKFVWSLIAAVFTMLAASGAAFAIDVNKASKAELESINGIGPTIADRIIAERKKGAFKDSGDLQTRIKGIGSKNVEKLMAGGLTVNGKGMAAAANGKDAAKDKAKAKAKDAAKEKAKAKAKDAAKDKAKAKAKDAAKDKAKAKAKDAAKDKAKAAAKG
ncbi:MAG: helix-hairpin-helix domain-containing protein [Burkholderiaceae bacterium]|nr:helix-hairpin-helix domain-containing protein [Burkholderiaceae bacterium]